MTVFTLRRFAIAFLVCAALSPVVQSAEPASLEAAMLKQVAFDFVKTPLADVLDYLSRMYGIPVTVDLRSLREAKIDGSNVSVTAKTQDRTLGVALDGLLLPHQLAWIIRHDVLLITTQSAAENKYFDTRVYKITRRVPVQRRMRSIMWTVAPQSWATVGGAGDVAPLPPKLLVVYQSPLRQRKIAATFSKSIAPVRSRRRIEPIKLGEVEKKLAAPTVIDFKEIRLPDALKRLSGRHSVKISLDDRALKSAEIQANDLLVTLRIGKIRSLASGLSLLLEQSSTNLTWIADDAGITVKTNDTAKSKLIHRTYDVKNILPKGGLKPLTEAIQFTIAAADWEDVGGDGTIRAGEKAGTLVISQSYPVHRQLRRLFAALRAGREG